MLQNYSPQRWTSQLWCLDSVVQLIISVVADPFVAINDALFVAWYWLNALSDCPLQRIIKSTEHPDGHSTYPVLHLTETGKCAGDILTGTAHIPSCPALESTRVLCILPAQKSRKICINKAVNTQLIVWSECQTYIHHTCTLPRGTYLCIIMQFYVEKRALST